MRKVILCPNPYRDSGFTVAKQARKILEEDGFATVMCLPFEYEGSKIDTAVELQPLLQEIKTADLLVAFGGDGTILHLARTVALHNVPLFALQIYNPDPTPSKFFGNFFQTFFSPPSEVAVIGVR